MPAGILSPYSDGERGAVINGFVNHRRCRKGHRRCDNLPSPRHYTGEGPGRRIRGSANGSRRTHPSPEIMT
ncbi:MAG: hypothetical protein EOS27_08080 [Mesorhizobium sp.]|nr:MAG: hypothetical protein EOS27_08080 [Mesorhizobium sp.]